ncbi:MAG TPA: bifunctional folylpolyglutamate synthase/dihydrofolate synthase, partial [bacterium]|nr:bifunctional folylpolyglutamate synthase/dihydrofolate synthase [bacterium]
MNDFQAALQYLYQLQNRGVKLGLDRVYKVREALDHPDEAYRTIHVAGTNGKGSTVHYIAAMLQSRDVSVGWYTSPHLVRFNERIRVDGVPISDAAIVQYIQQWRPRIDEHQLTFFEATTLLALDYFREQEVDVAVLETG